MKQIKFFAVALAALTMFSCSKENIETPPNAPGDKASLTISVTGQGNLKSGSKAIGAATGDAVVNNYIVFLFRDGGGIDCAPQHSSDGSPLTITEGTTAASTAYVVANTGALAGDFAAVKTETALKAVVGDLMTSENTSSQTADNLWMSGSGTIAYGTGDNAKKGNVTVTMAFVGAKIELIVKDNRTHMTDGTTTIVDKEVVLLFAGKDGKFFETAANQATQTDFYSGDNKYPDFTTSTISTALTDAVGTPFTANGSNAVFNHFYTFGNNGAIMPTILAIKSLKTVNGTTSNTYYPVQFTAEDAGSTIEPGKYYTVTLTLNGDVGGGEGGGTPDPEDPFIKADITVTVTPAEWDPVVVNKEFN